jgi:hypothetical protein
MISKPTVLILGAGASNHAGYPLGSELLNEICIRLANNAIPEEIKKQYSPDKLEGFRQRLSRSNYWSIDAFLEWNDDCRDLGKLLIAACLKDKESVDRLFPPHSPNWYRLLFGFLMGHAADTCSKAPLTIVTFNYDRSLEAYLHESIFNRYQVPSFTRDDATKVFRTLKILHPHGILGRYPDVPYQADLGTIPLEQIASQIHIIHELKTKGPDFCNEEFQKANEALQAAERIFFLGFGFHDENVERFRFFSEDNLKGKELFATVMFGGRQWQLLVDRLANYGIRANHLKGGDCNQMFTEYASLD